MFLQPRGEPRRRPSGSCPVREVQGSSHGDQAGPSSVWSHDPEEGQTWGVHQARGRASAMSPWPRGGDTPGQGEGRVCRWPRAGEQAGGARAGTERAPSVPGRLSSLKTGALGRRPAQHCCHWHKAGPRDPDHPSPMVAARASWSWDPASACSTHAPSPGPGRAPPPGPRRPHPRQRPPCPAAPRRPGPAPPREPACRPSAPPPAACGPAAPVPPAS